MTSPYKTITARRLKEGDKLIIASKVYPCHVTEVRDSGKGCITVTGKHNLVISSYNFEPTDLVKIKKD